MEEDVELPYEAKVLMEKMVRLAIDTNTRMVEIIKRVQKLPPDVKAQTQKWCDKNGGTLMVCTVAAPHEIVEKISGSKVVTGITHLGEPTPVQWASSLANMPVEQFFWFIRHLSESMILVHGPLAGSTLWEIIRHTAHVAGALTQMTTDMVKAKIEERYTKYLEENPPKPMGQA